MKSVAVTPAPITSHWRADLSLVTVAVLWGLNIPIMKHALGSMDALSFNAARLSLSAVTIAACVGWERRRYGPAKGTAPVGRVLTFAILSGFIYQVCFLLGIDHSTAGNTALIVSSMPMWTAILSHVFLGERLSKQAWTGLLITIPGVIAVTVERTKLSAASEHLVGNLLVLSAAILWASASVLSRTVLTRMSAMRLTLTASTVSLPLHYLTAYVGSTFDWRALTDPTTLACVAYSGVFSTGVAYALWNYGVQKVGAPHAANFQNFVPVVALIASWSVLGEVPLRSQYVGGMLIIGGLMVMRRGR